MHFISTNLCIALLDSSDYDYATIVPHKNIKKKERSSKLKVAVVIQDKDEELISRCSPDLLIEKGHS